MKKKLVLNTTMSLLLQVVSVICGFILPRMILECYGTEVNGLIQSIAQFLSVISFMELGVGQVIQSSLYRPLSLGNIESVSKVLKSGDSFFKKLAYALLGYTAVICIIYPIAFDVKQGRIYTIMLIVAMSISSFTQYCFGLIDKILLSADQKGYIQYAVQIICNVLNVMVISYFIYKKCSIQSVKFASAAVFLIGPIIIRCYINKKYKIDRKIKYDEEPVKQKWNGIAQHIANVILEGTDIIILTTFSTLSNVSVYSVYFMVISGVRQLYTSITAGVQSMIGTLWAKNEIDNLKDVFLSVEIILHFIVVFLFSCIAVLIVPFVKVYTLGIIDYEYVNPIFALILTLAYAVRCLRVPYNILILAGGHYKQTQTCHIVAAILNIIVSIVGVLLWGLVGIAIGTLVAYVYQTLWMVVYNSKNLLHWPIRNVAKQIVIDVFTVALIYLATMWINMKEVSYIGWFTMAIMVAAIAMIITITMLILFYRTQLKKMYRMIKQ